jgi:HEPN domain-containing protein
MNGPELQSEARRWLRFAQEDLRVAERLLASPDSVPRHVCWFAQQAAEKSLKAGLVLEGIEFPFRHDLDGLRNLLPPGWSVKEAYPDLAS